ncbi:MAG TPA: hypothetical protein VIQ23_01215 [Hanamia sp.]
MSYIFSYERNDKIKFPFFTRVLARRPTAAGFDIMKEIQRIGLLIQEQISRS